MLIVLAVVLLLFGGAKLPKLARSLGEAQREFRDGQVNGAAEVGVVTSPSEITRPPLSSVSGRVRTQHASG